ncbi:hypothetical protein U6A24_09250 [Aquimarina gracilis]|uniref:Uncharacterized protein n=1 Tax=Aquimarina gracilis TaxID=874422 RepID=A0ABU5ZUA7_9FLAO|nr:hypothetical protein [Aquimarina gracilis]MEB3345645.1 hypothetical protein [Aquimarina gracilis]
MKDDVIKKILEQGIEKIPNQNFNADTIKKYKKILEAKKVRQSKNESLVVGLVIAGLILVSMLFFVNFDFKMMNNDSVKISESVSIFTIFLFVFSMMILASDLIDRKRAQ